MKKVTLGWLERNEACSDGIEYYKTLSTTDARELIHSCLSKSRFDWAVWLLVKLMSSKQRLSFAIFCAEKVLPIYEKKYPGDMRPRLAIAAAKKVLARNTKQSRAAARGTASAAAYADAAARAAASAYASTYASSAADAAIAAADSADLKQEIVSHGLKILGYSKD